MAHALPREANFLPFLSITWPENLGDDEMPIILVGGRKLSSSLGTTVLGRWELPSFQWSTKTQTCLQSFLSSFFHLLVKFDIELLPNNECGWVQSRAVSTDQRYQKAHDKRLGVGQMDKDQSVICTALVGNLQVYTTL